MGLLAVVLFVATAADVLEGLARLEPVFVAALFFASSVVEVHAYLIVAHEVLRDTVDVLFALGGRRFRLAATVVVRLPPVRESVVLWDMLESRPDTLEAGLDHRPVGPLEFFHHPGHHHLVASIEDLLMRIIERHFYEKLSEQDFIRQSGIEIRRRCLGQDLGQHAVDELVEGQIFVCGEIVPGDPWLKHFMRPADLSKHKSGADLISSGRHDFLQFGHVYSYEVTLYFEHWAHMYPEASSDCGVFNTVS